VIEIRVHGRGGQGSVTAAELLGFAAHSDGKYAQAFPSFGSERMGAPVQAFVRISDKPIRIRSQVYEPDYVIVQDPTLLEVINVLDGLQEDGLLLINSKKKATELGINTKVKVKTIPAMEIALEVIGRPIMNTILLGAFAAATGEISLEGIQKAIHHKFPGSVGEKNIAAVLRAFDFIKKEAL
jgi:pyruvate ferredoxin oxidoreductase gamma subunit